MAQAAQEFASPYLFKKADVTVVLTHMLEKNIRSKPHDMKRLDADGGSGHFARFTTKLREKDGYIEVQFKNEKTGDFMRIHEGGKDIDCAGKGLKLCWFKVHFQGVGAVKLESAEFKDKYIAVDNEGVRVGSGGPWCRLFVLKEGPPPAFSKPYRFMKNNTVIIEHRDCKNIRVDGKHVRSDGGIGEFARFEAIPDGGKVQIKSLKTGEYLRIKDGHVDCAGKGGKFTLFKVVPVDAPNHVRLESVEFPGEFVALDPDKNSLKVTNGKHKNAFFTFYRDN